MCGKGDRGCSVGTRYSFANVKLQGQVENFFWVVSLAGHDAVLVMSLLRKT